MSRGDKMSAFTVGQVVKLKVFDCDLGFILTECKEPEGYWCVALRKQRDGRVQIMSVAGKDLEPYQNHCWNCGKTGLSSEIHPTCVRCGWIRCPECFSCEKELCGSHQLLVYPRPGSLDLPDGYEGLPKEVALRAEELFLELTKEK